jgi:hypothetical protein
MINIMIANKHKTIRNTLSAMWLSCALASPAYTATLDMPMSVRIINCSDRDKAKEMCVEEKKCCSLAEDATKDEEDTSNTSEPETPAE